MSKEGDLRFYWIPQVGAPIPKFLQDVSSVEIAKALYTAFAEYDLFQYDNQIKPDYSNSGGLMVFEDGEWQDWWNEDGESIDEVIRNETE